MFGSISHSVSGWLKKKKKEQEKAVETVAPVAATAVGGPGAGAAVEAGIQAKQAAEAQKEAAEAKKEAAKQEEETAEEEKTAKEEYEEKFYRKKLEQEFPEKKGGGFLDFLKKGYEKEKHELKLTGIKGLGERKEAAKKTVSSSIQFVITLPITIWLLFSFTIPTVEGYMGKPILSREFSWIQTSAVEVALLVFVFVLVVLLIPSLIRGGRGIDLSLPNGIILTILAFSVGVWLFDNPFFSFMGYVKAAHPEEYELMMCLIKYGGNMQICALGQEEIQYEKEGTYETLKLDMGIVTPGRTIPPMRPKLPLDDEYDFLFTLKNENEIGSLYDIVVPEEGIEIMADSKMEGTDLEPQPYDSLFFPLPYNIKPGEQRVVQAIFTELPQECKNYMYFHINITSEQHGGGSAKYGIVSRERDNENFMYFFDPDIVTNPGPLDIYLYTYPFVLPVIEITDRPDDDFKIYIVIDNKVGGIAELVNVTLIHTTELTPAVIQSIDCNGVSDNSNDNIIRLELCENGACASSLLSEPIETGEENRIYLRCKGTITGNSFDGKATDFISIIVDYLYTQIFEEQIGCSSKTDLERDMDCAGDCINQEGQNYVDGRCLCDASDEYTENIGQNGCSNEWACTEYLGQYAFPAPKSCYCKPGESGSEGGAG